MAVLQRSELEASPLGDLHAIAGQIGLEGFRRLRKAELIDAILQGPREQDDPGESGESATGGEEERDGTVRKRRFTRSRRSSSSAKVQKDDSAQVQGDDSAQVQGDETGQTDESSSSRGNRPSTSSTSRRGRGRSERGGAERRGAQDKRGAQEQREGTRGRAERTAQQERTAEGVVELLGNGSAFLRVDPPEPSDEDAYISAAQVRRCELVSGDRVSGPVRTPRRSERYPSLVRIDTINGTPADAASEGTRYEELAVAYPSERLVLGSDDLTLQAIERLTPLGRGTRAVITGATRAGKTETLRRILGALAGREGLELTLLLTGVRPEEMPEWQEGPVAPAAALSFAASADSQGQAVEHAVEIAKRVAARGGHAVVLIDSLDGLQPHVARRTLAAARNLSGGGSLTVIGTAARPFGGETTVIALDVALTSTGRPPILDLLNSGTLRPELLIGEDGAEAITKARAATMEAAS